jgi:WhiB family redox-sensing transcriptional regulator
MSDRIHCLDTITDLTAAGTSLDHAVVVPTPHRAIELDGATVDRVFDELTAIDQHDRHDQHDQHDQHGTPVTLRTPQARCADGHGTLTHLFFSDDVLDIARAKAICSKCGLAPTCLSGALDRAEPWGVWGGELIENGRIVVHKRPRGRPPKHPRPLVIVDEVPIPPHLVA